MIRLFGEILLGGGMIGGFFGWCITRYLDWRFKK